jgi:crotonobetainyl-CoA:carnitine CoA-transferase CaiB-like acyl-CoA transferase
MTRPLEGIRILDMSRILAGPWGTQTMADMGAEVIKVERPVMGDDSRLYGPPFLKSIAGEAIRQTPMYVCANRNKRSIAVDYTKPEGRDILAALADQSDVLIENYKVGTLQRYGLGYEHLKARNPRLVYCSLSGYGQTGPYADRGATDPIVQAMGGMMSMTGHPEGEPGGTPMKAGPSIIDIAAGLYAVVAIQGALYHRDLRGGSGQYIDLSLLDAGVTVMGQQAMHYFMAGVAPKRMGTEANGGAPGGGFRCADGDIMIAPNSQDLYERMCKALGAPELATDPRFLTNPKRVENRRALKELLHQITTKKTVQEVYDTLNAVGVPCTPINTIEQVFADPQVVHRNMTVEVPSPHTGTVKLMRNPIRYSDTPLDTYTAPPQIGEHTDEVLTAMLGLDAQRLAALRAEKVIG